MSYEVWYWILVFYMCKNRHAHGCVGRKEWSGESFSTLTRTMNRHVQHYNFAGRSQVVLSFSPFYF